MNEKEIAKKLGQRIKQTRETAKLTQAELAEKIGLSTNFIGIKARPWRWRCPRAYGT